MQAIFVDLHNEVAEIGREAVMLSRSLDEHAVVAPEDDLKRWQASLIFASAIEKIYTGIERIMAQFAAAIDGAAIEHREGWHRALLMRLANEFPGVRGPVLSPACREALDRLRAFRHRERNSYGLALDHDIVVERAQEALAALALFKEDLRRFEAIFDPPA